MKRDDIKWTWHFAWLPTRMSSGRRVYDKQNSARTYLEWTNSLTLRGKRDGWDFT